MSASEVWWLVAVVLAALGALGTLLAPAPPLLDRILLAAGVFAAGAVAAGLWALP